AAEFLSGDQLDARRVRRRPEDARRIHAADPKPETVVRVRDLYEILGVARDADTESIRKAYRKLARKNHPDLNPGDKAAEERFKEISRAWEVLESPERRRNYDEFGEISLEAGFDAERARQAREAFGSRFGTGGRPGADEFGEQFEFGDLDDLMGRF